MSIPPVIDLEQWRQAHRKRPENLEAVPPDYMAYARGIARGLFPELFTEPKPDVVVKRDTATPPEAVTETETAMSTFEHGAGI